MRFLKQIDISGYKSIESMAKPLELGHLNVLIGANGSGKSNLLSFFQLIREMQYQRLQKYVLSWGANALLFYGAKVTQKLEANLLLQDDDSADYYGYYIKLTATQQDSLLPREKISFKTSHGRGDYGCGAAGLAPESQLEESIKIWENDPKEASQLAATKGKVIAQHVKNWGIFRFSDTSANAGIRRRCYLHDNQVLHSDGSNLAAILHKIHESQGTAYNRILGTIRQIAPWFGDFVLEPIKPNETDMLLNWRDRYSDDIFGPHQLPDGTLRAMALITLLLQPWEDLPSLIIIDEPELGLHPNAIAIIAALLNQAAFHSQVIIATQSPILVDEFEPEDIIVVDREQGKSTFSRQSPEKLREWLEEYSLGEIWQKNVIGGGPF
jgi:predicted ATPase